MKHVSLHNGRFVWQITILGHPVRSVEHFDEAVDAGLSADLFKHYLRSEFRLDLPLSLEGELFSSLAYSRRAVFLSNSLSVFVSLTDSAKQFIAAQRAALEAHKEAHPESLADKFRRSGEISRREVLEWVENLDAAKQDELAFAEINSASFFLRLSVVERSVTTALTSLALAVKMHKGVTNEKLVERARLLVELETNFKATEIYVKFLSVSLAEEQKKVVDELARLESIRPPLT